MKRERVDDRDRAGRTPLHYAVIDDPSPPNVELLRAARTDPEVAERNRVVASEYKVRKTTELLEAGSDVNAADDQGFTPLLFAADNDSVDVVELLLDAGADIEAATDKGITAIYVAVRNTTSGAVPIARLLLARGANPNAPLWNGSSAVNFVRRSQKPGIIDLFTDLP